MPLFAVLEDPELADKDGEEGCPNDNKDDDEKHTTPARRPLGDNQANNTPKGRGAGKKATTPVSRKHHPKVTPPQTPETLSGKKDLSPVSSLLAAADQVEVRDEVAICNKTNAAVAEKTMTTI